MQKDNQPVQANACEIDLKKEYVQEIEYKAKPEHGMNDWHGIKYTKVPQLCQSLINNRECTNKNCKNIHNVEEYMKIKPPEIPIQCHEYETYGQCRFKQNCIFSHKNNTGDYINNNAPRESFQQKEAILNSCPDFYAKLKEITKDSNEVKEVNDRADHVNRNLEKLRHTVFLAPMCTVGVLPFRRWCWNFGCTASCSEMIFVRDLLKGQAMAKVQMRRHPSERFFGLQITGNQPKELQQAIRLLYSVADFDYIELNAACPQDIACQRHCGFALAQNHKLGTIGNAMSQALNNETILSIKTRIGDFSGNSIISRLLNTDMSAISSLDNIVLHGRTARQRYQKSADWSALQQFNKLLKDQNLGVNFVGNGDVYHWEDAEAHVLNNECDAIMIGRGALYKPWLFQEIQERRRLDPGPTQRMQYYKQFANYLLDHFGSDRLGIEKAREQFLENWVYLSRYVPPGILNSDQQLNQRIIKYHGRDEMEELLGSQDPQDWVRITEYFFGSVPDGFVYQPKHRSKGQVQG